MFRSDPILSREILHFTETWKCGQAKELSHCNCTLSDSQTDDSYLHSNEAVNYFSIIQFFLFLGKKWRISRNHGKKDDENSLTTTRHDVDHCCSADDIPDKQEVLFYTKVTSQGVLNFFAADNFEDWWNTIETCFIRSTATGEDNKKGILWRIILWKRLIYPFPSPTHSMIDTLRATNQQLVHPEWPSGSSTKWQEQIVNFRHPLEFFLPIHESEKRRDNAL